MCPQSGLYRQNEKKFCEIWERIKLTHGIREWRSSNSVTDASRMSYEKIWCESHHFSWLLKRLCGCSHEWRELMRLASVFVPMICNWCDPHELWGKLMRVASVVERSGRKWYKEVNFIGYNNQRYAWTDQRTDTKVGIARPSKNRLLLTRLISLDNEKKSTLLQIKTSFQNITAEKYLIWLT